MSEFGHTLSLDFHLDDIEEISLPGEFQEVADCVNNEITNTMKILESNVPNILDQLAIDSQQLQQEALSNHGSIVTRNLYDSIVITGEGNTRDIGTDVFYAKYVNDGRGPVHAKNAKCLHFITKGGVEVFTKSVGPASPRPYIDESDEELTPVIEELVTEVIEACL